MPTFSYKNIYSFKVCGHSIRIAKYDFTDLFYVQKYINGAYRNVHSHGFESFQVALDYAIARSVSTIKAGALSGCYSNIHIDA